MPAREIDGAGSTSLPPLWSNPSTAEFWRYWQYGWDHFVRGATDLLQHDAAIVPDMTVLDVGSGHGEPALTLAFTVGPGGLVAATDVATSMLALAEEQAAIVGLGNITFTVADAASLPFRDATFDAVVSRFSMMYVDDPGQAAAEIRRVLKPGGRFACAVWGAADDVPWHARAMQVLSGYIDAPPVDPHGQSPFRFGEAGSLKAVLAAGGLNDVQEVAHKIMLEWRDGLASFVTFIEGLFCGTIAQVPTEHHALIREQLHTTFHAPDDSELVQLPATVIVALGTAPTRY